MGWTDAPSLTGESDHVDIAGDEGDFDEPETWAISSHSLRSHSFLHRALHRLSYVHLCSFQSVMWLHMKWDVATLLIS